MMANLLEEITELKQKIVSLEAEIEKYEEQNNDNKRYRGDLGECYYYVDDANLIKDTFDCRCDIDNTHYENHNYFQTKSEVDKYADVLETEIQLKKFADENNSKIDWGANSAVKYYLCYNYNAQIIYIDSVCASREPRIIYFSSKEIAQKAIDTIGVEEVKQYVTYEW